MTPLLVEHLKDNEGELLPNLLLGDVIRWLLEHHRDEEDTCREVFAWLEDQARDGPEMVMGMIGVSGVWNLPDQDGPDAAIWRLVGPLIRQLDPWDPVRPGGQSRVEG